MAGVAQLGEQQTEASQETRLLRLRSNLEVPCSIHGPGIFFPTSEVGDGEIRKKYFARKCKNFWHDLRVGRRPQIN